MKNRIPRGTQDIISPIVYDWQKLESILRELCLLYNFDEIRTPTFEHTSVFLRENDSSDMVNKEMYTFSPSNSTDSLTLRPEGTAGVIRSYVENKLYAAPDLPVKLYYMGPMHRHERPQKGRLRIFNQFGVEVLGLKDPLIDVETIVLGYEMLKQIGLKDVVVEINSLGDEKSRQAYREALKKYFEKDLDTLCEDCKRRYEQNPLRILDCKIDGEKELVKNAPSIQDYLTDESRAYFAKVIEMLEAFGIPYRINENLVRGLDYYTDTVFEMKTDQKNLQGLTLLAGGRYDQLINESGGPEQSGIGFALGMERLILALESSGISLSGKPGLDAYVISLSPESRQYALKLVKTLRDAGIRTDMDFAGRSLKAQFKASERNKAAFLILVGTKEMESGQLNLKNTRTRQQQTVGQDQIVEVLKEMLDNQELENETNA